MFSCWIWSAIVFTGDVMVELCVLISSSYGKVRFGFADTRAHRRTDILKSKEGRVRQYVTCLYFWSQHLASSDRLQTRWGGKGNSKRQWCLWGMWAWKYLQLDQTRAEGLNTAWFFCNKRKKKHQYLYVVFSETPYWPMIHIGNCV